MEKRDYEAQEKMLAKLVNDILRVVGKIASVNQEQECFKTNF